jgi:flagellar hook-length control protein FliK
MTQALMDLGSRLDLKPVGGQGDSRGSADSGAAFAEAVDQAVSTTKGRSQAPDRGESGRDDDRRTSEARDQYDDESGDTEHAAGAAAATTVVWALTPHDLRATQVPPGKGGDRLDVVDVTASPARRARLEQGISEAGLAHRSSAAPTTAGTAAARHSAASDAHKAASGVAAAHPGSPSSAADPSKDGTAIDAGRGNAAATAAKGADAPAPTHTPAGPARPRLAVANDTSGNSATSDVTAALDAADGKAAEKALKHTATPKAAASATVHASANSAVNAAANPTNVATTDAASQVSPTTVHVPTAVAATVNSTPVAVATPMPTPFAQAQPDVANILAQLRGRSDGTYQLRAQVHPAELGVVAITATVHHGALTLTLSPDQAAQQAISQSLPQLRQHLADQGFTGVNVGLGSPDQSGQHGQGGGDRGSRAQGSDHSSLHGPDVAIGATGLASAGRAAGTQSALDLML